MISKINNLILLIGMTGIVCFCLIFLVSCKKKSLTGKPVEYFYKDEQLIELCNAISENDESKVDKLLSKGIDINAMGNEGMTPLAWALCMNDKSIFEMVLKKGGNPNIRLSKKTGDSVMTLVVSAKNLENLKLALKYGGNPNYQDIDYRTLLFYAISLDKDSLKRVKILVNAGADINHQTMSEITPMIKASLINQYHIVCYLLNTGADPALKDNGNSTIVDYMKQSYNAMDHKNKLYGYLLKAAQLIRKKGMKVDLEAPRIIKFKPLPKDWVQKRRAEAEKKKFKNVGSKPTIY
jgi:uncharacterized protein